MKSFPLAFIAFMLCQSAHATLQMKPGKWRVETLITQEGKSDQQAVDAMSKLKDAMKSMTPAQRKQMEEMMAKMGKAKGDKTPKIGFDKEGMTICYTKEMLESGLDLKKQQEEQKCTISNHRQTSKLISMKFKCENGSSGESEWKVLDETHMKGVTKIVSAKGERSEINYKTEYLGSKCD